MKYELFIERRAQRQLAKIAQPYQDRIISPIRASQKIQDRQELENSPAEKAGAFASASTGLSMKFATNHFLFSLSQLVIDGKSIADDKTEQPLDTVL